MDRRTFLKITGMGSIGFAAGCSSNPEGNLYTLVQAPEDMVTGQAAWYATTCRECPAGCGVLARNREGRVIKLEGNPRHPVNKGKLCARGQAALQGVYNPDRIKTPLLKKEGRWQSIDDSQAIELLRQRLQQAAADGDNRIGMLSEVVGDSILSLMKQVLAAYGAQGPLVYEPFGFESLKFAHNLLFKQPVLPELRMEKADLLINFGADFLETWLSPVAYARKFTTMHTMADGRKGFYLHISPYQSLTAANADKWLSCQPGTEAAVVLMLIKSALLGLRGRHLQQSITDALLKLTNPYTFGNVADMTGLSTTQLRKLTNRMLTARHPLILGAGTVGDGAPTATVDLASAMLNLILDPTLTLYDFGRRHRVEIAAPRSEVSQLLASATDGGLDLLLLNNVNPLFSLPRGSGITRALDSDRLFVAAFSNVMDETAAAADLILPIPTWLESWDTYESFQGIKATLQPVLGQLTSTPGLGDLLVQLLPKAQPPAADYRSHLIQYLESKGEVSSSGDWVNLFQGGGRLTINQEKDSAPQLQIDQKAVTILGKLISQLPAEGAQGQVVYLSPSLRHLDGRGANRSWLSEIPDPISQVAWQTVAWLHPDLMTAKDWKDGDDIHLSAGNGQIKVKAYGYGGLHPNAVVVPMGQGHSLYGRYAENQGANPVELLEADIDPLSGTPRYIATLKKIDAADGSGALATTSGSRIQYKRKIALSVKLEKAQTPDADGKGLTMNDFPLALPLPEGYDHHRDIYKPHDHENFRWAMVVDLDRCTGCSACVAACYAENNIGVVGERQVIKGREMAWIRIERYEKPYDPADLIFFPMMCQHCDNAPCEPVCPVYAPHHSKEGLNNQIYNRCIGTRFCAQNCPYKVRRFNWFEWQWPEPLPMQLNPSVTVRSKGVMEKCSFCVQRIKAAHNHAKNENRAVRDGEVVPACVQTCPTGALFFGNLMDEKSVVRQLTTDPRAYQVMGYLNVKPAVIYLKKVIQTL